jgi:hypothetical protein
VRSHASIAAARRTYACADVSTGPSLIVVTGSAAFVMRADGGGGGDSGVLASKLSAGSAAAAMFGLAAAAPSIAGKRPAGARDDADADDADAELAHVPVERSITPRWIRSEGNTLSTKTGRCEVCGMGKDEGEGSLSLFAPKRMTIALIRKSAFLKQ